MKSITLALTSLAALAVIGCNREPAATSSTTGAPSGGVNTGKTLRIVFIPKNSGNPYFNEVDRGFAEAAKDLGFDYTTAAPATGDATSQIPIIKEQVQRGVDVIAIAANSPDALNPALAEARSRGITIITVDADLVGNETHRDAAVLPTNFDEIGSSQVELLGSSIGYEGDIAILSATTDAPNQNAWIAKMKETLAQPKYAKMHLIDTVYGDDEPQKSTTECEALLAKHPDLRGIISPTSVGLAAGAQVVERAGVYPGGPQAKGKGLVLTGLSTPNQLKKFVQKGVVQSFQLWAPYNEGYLAAEIGAQIHDLKLKPAPDVAVDTKKFGSVKFTRKLEIYAGPLQTFDAKNIDSFNF